MLPAPHHCHSPDSSAAPWQSSPALGRPTDVPARFSCLLQSWLTETRYAPTEVSGNVIFIIYGTSSFERDQFHEVPRSMHSIHRNPLSSTSWRTHPPPETRQKVVLYSLEVTLGEYATHCCYFVQCIQIYLFASTIYSVE